MVIDPKNGDEFPVNFYYKSGYEMDFNATDYFVICSPSHFHRSQMQYLLSNLNSTWKQFQIICEKPAFLPWEPIIDNDRINIVLQLRYMPEFQEKVGGIYVHWVRDEEYFKHWQGDSRKTGGLFFHLFIHFIDLAIKYDVDFEGLISHSGKEQRLILGESKSIKEPIFDIANNDKQACYNRMYEAILEGNGIKPKDLFYLNWVLQRNSEIFGYGRDAIGKTITIGRELL